MNYYLTLKFTCVFICLVLAIASMYHVAAEEVKFNLPKLENELSKTSYSSSGTIKIKWLPEEYWDIALDIDPTVNMLVGEKMLSTIRPYNIFIVSRSEIGSNRIPRYDTRTALLNNIKLVDKEGNKYTPYYNDKIKPDMQRILYEMKQSLSEDFEVDKEYLHFFLFPSYDTQEKRITDPVNSGSFSLLIDIKEFKWQLPLSELIPKKKCPTDGKMLDGTWKYCPLHGVELQTITN